MKIHYTLADIPPYHGAAVALGTFDGVHVGHQRIIGQAVALAHRAGTVAAVFTFSNHPMTVLHPEHSQVLLATQADKERLLAALGVDVLAAVPFDAALFTLSPAAFVREVLVAKFNPRWVVVGPNYTFGARGRGTPAVLTELGRQCGFTVAVQEGVYVNGVMVSSTVIRQRISRGDVADAAKLLGRPPHLKGTVIAGEGRGRRLGYPTANLSVPADLVLPGDGVYAVKATLDGQRWYAGAANMGTNPTFGHEQRRLEVHLLDFAGDIYGRTLTVQFIQRLRDEIAFTDAAALKAQMAVDITQIRKLCSVNKKSGSL